MSLLIATRRGGLRQTCVKVASKLRRVKQPKMTPFRFFQTGVKSHHDMKFAPWR